MRQIYLLSLLLVGLLFFMAPIYAQESRENEPAKEEEVNIEGLSIYPNPALGDKIFIRTKLEQDKMVEVFNVLGKPVLSIRLTGNELNISSLEKGIYFLKIREDEKTSTRKLVVR